MTRQLKPQIVDEVSSPNGHVKLPVFFDRNDKDFYVEVIGPEGVAAKKLGRSCLLIEKSNCKMHEGLR